MKILLATAALDDIRWAVGHALIDGVLTTPALLDAEVGHEGNPHERLAEIARLSALPLYASVASVDSDDMYADGRDLARIADHIVVQLPFVEDSLDAMRKLRAEGVRLCASLVFTPAQAVLAANAGASSISVALDALDEVGLEAPEIIREMRAVADAHSADCDIMALLPADAARFGACVLAGADSVAVTPAVLRALLAHPLTDRGLDLFLIDLSKRHRVRPS